MKQATPSKKECVLFPFQTQLQSLLYNPTYNKHNNMHGTTVKKKKKAPSEVCNININMRGLLVTTTVTCHGSGSYPQASVVEKEEQRKVFL